MFNRKRFGHRFAIQRGTLPRVALWVVGLGALMGIGWVGHLELITREPHSGDFSHAYAQSRPSTSSRSRLKKQALELARLREELEQQQKLLQSLIAPSESLAQRQGERVARLEDELRQNRRRLDRLERDRTMVERIAEKESGSVGLILGEYIWVDQATGQPLR